MQLIGRTLTSLVVVVVFLGGAAFGQTANSVIKVKIPFEFNLGALTFPAGDYSLVQPMQHLLVLRDARGQTVATALTNGVDTDGPVAAPKLRFTAIGERHILTELWQPQYPAGLRLYGSNREVAAAERRLNDDRTAATAGQP